MRVRGGRLLLAISLVALVLMIAGASVSAAKVKIVYWHGWGGDEKKVVEDVVAEFNRTHSNIEVEAVTIFGSYDKLLTAIAAGTPPDVTSAVWSFQTADLASRGALLPLDKYFQQSRLDSSIYVKPIWDAMHYEGKLYAMPVLANYSMTAYNKDHFKAAGLPDRGPGTVAELTEWAHKLSQVTRGRITRLGYLPSAGNFAVYTHMFGGSLYDSERRAVTPDNPGVIKAAEWMRDYYQKYGYVAVQAFQASFGSYASPDNPFFSGKISMQDGWGEWIVNFTKWYAPNFNYGRFPYPTVDGSPGFATWAGSVWAIPTGSKHPDEAWEFMQWLSAGEGGKMLALRLSNASARLVLNESPEFLATMPVLKDALPLLKENRLISALPIFPGNTEFFQRVEPVLDSVLAGQAQVEQALKELTKAK